MRRINLKKSLATCTCSVCCHTSHMPLHKHTAGAKARRSHVLPQHVQCLPDAHHQPKLLPSRMNAQESHAHPLLPIMRSPTPPLLPSHTAPELLAALPHTHTHTRPRQQASWCRQLCRLSKDKGAHAPTAPPPAARSEGHHAATASSSTASHTANWWPLTTSLVALPPFSFSPLSFGDQSPGPGGVGGGGGFSRVACRGVRQRQRQGTGVGKRLDKAPRQRSDGSSSSRVQLQQQT